MTPKLTLAGYQLMSRALAGTQITFTRFEIGNGEMPEDYTVLTALGNTMQTIGIDSIEIQPKFAVMTGTLNNAEITDGFQWTEIGIFCADPDGGTDDILYAYGHYQMYEGAQPTWIPKFSNDVVEMTLNEYIYIGEAEDVTAALSTSAQYATQADLNEHVQNEDNPHNVTAEQVGLGNVPNVSTDDQTPTVQEAETLLKLSNGNTMKTIIGRVAKAISELILHLKDGTVHVSTDDRKAWNAKANGTHNHSANEITSGTLGLTRGGTGAGDAASARKNLIGSTAIGGSTNPIYWNGSQFTKIPYTIQKSVPGDAKFTDTVYTLPVASGSTRGGVKMQTGLAGPIGVKAGTYSEKTITFSGFSSQPVLFACITSQSTNKSLGGVTCSAWATSESGGIIRLHNNSDVDFEMSYVRWLAVSLS